MSDPRPDGFVVDMSDPHYADLDALRQLNHERGGGHGWVIQTVHALDDPEQAMDSMELTEKTFVGVSDIHCLWCRVSYDTAIRSGTCSQVPDLPQD